MVLSSDKKIRKLNGILEDFRFYTKNPVLFLSSQERLQAKIKNLLKNLYDLMKSAENVQNKEQTLSNLLINGFDLEQIWQQIEYHNCVKDEQFDKNLLNNNTNSRSLYFIKGVNKISNTIGEKLRIRKETNNVSDSSDADSSDYENDNIGTDNDTGEEDDNDNGENSISENEDACETNNFEQKKTIFLRNSVVDDKFFKLSEMESFLINMEKNDGKLSSTMEDDIDYYNDVSSSDNESKISNDEETDREKYFDFFAEPEGKKKKSVNFNLRENSGCESECSEDQDEGEKQKNSFGSDENDDETNKVKSTFESRQERINKNIKQLEEDIIAEKPWQMKGEIVAKKRPQNSLLEEVLEFDLSTRPAPIITDEIMMKLDDVIIRRIKDKAWDDVERKIKPVDAPHEFKKKLILNQEKSKQSLAEIYEQAYVKQRDEIGGKKGDGEEQEPIEHKQLKNLTNLLFKKLDALSNYHFTPMPIAPEIGIISNIPAITIEEVAPISVSDATLLAPEEIQGKKKGLPIANEERTKTDKKRQHRRKKLRQTIKQKEIIKREKTLEKLNTGQNTKYSRDKVKKELEKLVKSNKIGKLKETADKKSVASSQKFFDTLQDKISNPVAGGTKRKKSNNFLTAKKVKL